MQIAVLQPPPGLNVELSYSYVTTTNLEEHGKEQKLCQLKLNGAVTEGDRTLSEPAWQSLTSS